MKKQLRGFVPPVLAIAGLISMPAFAAGIQGKVPAKGIIMDTAIKLDAKSAPELIGHRGIIMGTARQLSGKPLLLQARDNRFYQLADGIYKNSNGIQLHIRNGAIVKVSFLRDRR